ncbi:MAG: peptide ABC transporter substrate-binding protein [Clostridia bacterium]|nr:peptide ABC transporter substrate-binding protein [Clostridia bacterium]
MIRKFLSLSLCIIMLFLFTACTPRGAEANLCFPIDNDPRYLDPQVVSDTGAKNIIANCFEGLVSLNSDGSIAPGCAESWTVSSDNLTYTFNLRQNCKWAIMNASSEFLGDDFRKSFDNRVTAHDFVFGFRRALLPETESPGARNLFSIENAELVNKGTMPAESLGVKAIGDYTLTIKLTQADPDFFYVLLEPECMPCNQKFFEATGGKYGLSTRFLMYNGPFYMSNWADDYSITLMSNDDYYDFDNVKPYSIYYSINNEQSTRVQKIKDEIYNVAPLSAAQAQELGNKRGYTVNNFDSGIFGLAFNCKDEITSNINIRKALAYSFDQEVLFSLLGERTAGGIIPDSMLFSGAKYRDSVGMLNLTKDENAKNYLQAGLDQLDADSISLTLLCSEEYENAVRNVLQKWQSVLGVKLSVFVEVATKEEITEVLNEGGDWQLVLTDIAFPSLTAFSGLIQFTTGNSANFIGYSDKNFDSLVSNIKTASGFNTGINAIKEAEQYLLDSCVIIPLYDSPIYYGLGKNVSNIVFNTTGEILYFKNTLVK